ncbi:MAG: helix-turn-helix domain-containing protein [Nocardiopsaceae bacterium]|nr:helix-turn-helix domain-containing protein [Nocardiopsaceae bacterium]
MNDHRAENIDPGAHRVLADVSRVAVLEAVRRAGRPLSVPEIAAEVGLHTNTVRSHLALLTDHGYVVAAAEDRSRPGRPRLLYSAVPDDSGGSGGGSGERRNYRLLAEALVTYLAEQSDDREEAAVAAGRVYGQQAVRRQPPLGEVDAAAATRTVVRLLDEIGFEPREAVNGHIDLHRCPFREIAETAPDVVCGVHLGIMRGALAELGAPVEATGLRPFVEPDRCVAELRTDSGEGR